MSQQRVAPEPAAEPHPPDDWIRGLLQPAAYRHPVSDIQLIETHISWVLLTGQWAYKIKKPVSLGFVDFSTRARRLFFCEEELRLNRRLAPEIYLRVVPVTGDPQQPQMDGTGPVIDYAICMVQFDNERLLIQLARQSQLTAGHIDQLADLVGRFHQTVARAAADSTHASLSLVLQPALQNFAEIAELTQPQSVPRLDELHRWTAAEFAQRRSEFQRRAEAGMIRECHGDLHLGNMFVSAAGQVVVFDGIDFNDSFRWIDIISEVAFTMMDLEDRGYRGLAWRYLNRWLEITGDFDGLPVLRFYLVYRAMVRAKVDLIRARQQDVSRELQQELDQECRSYLQLARSYLQPPQPMLLITHGLSGSGKTCGTQALLEELALIRVRSDVERKRLAGLAAAASSGSAPGAGLYAQQQSVAVYQRLLELAAQLLQAGWPVVLDATFLKHTERAACAALAARLQVPFAILEFSAPVEVLKERVQQRRLSTADASEATPEIVDLQLQTQVPLTESERAVVIPGSPPGLVERVRTWLQSRH